MLVLTRRVGERVVIGDGIVVTVIEVRSDKVKLGFMAPAEVRVDREEVHDLRKRDAGSAPVGG